MYELGTEYDVLKHKYIIRAQIPSCNKKIIKQSKII